MKFFVEWMMPILLVFGIAMACIVCAGKMMDNQSRYRVEHHRCLQNATNGEEIERCG